MDDPRKLAALLKPGLPANPALAWHPALLGQMKPVEKPTLLPSTGRPLLRNEDGSVSTEESITVIDPRLNGGRPTNIPSIWGGRRTSSDDEAVQEALRSGQTFPAFGSIDEAVAAAIARSNKLGREIDSMRGTSE